MMNKKKLEVLEKVAKVGSISAAAKELFISQPALSQTVSSIEKEYGCQVLTKQNNRLVLTYEGEEIIKTVRRQLILQQNLERKLADAADGQEGRLNIGLSPIRAQQFLPEIIPLFRAKYPRVKVVVHTTLGFEKKVLSGDLDLAFVMDNLELGIDPVDQRMLVYEPLFRYAHLLAVPPQHPLAQEAKKIYNWNKRPPIDLRQVAGEPFISCTGNRYVLGVRPIWEAYQFKPQIILELSSTETLFPLVQAGVGFALGQDSYAYNFCKRREGAFFRLDKGEFEHNLCAIYRTDTYVSNAMRDFVSLVKEKTDSGVWNRID